MRAAKQSFSSSYYINRRAGVNMAGEFPGTPTEFLAISAQYCVQRYSETGKTVYLEVADILLATIQERLKV